MHYWSVENPHWLHQVDHQQQWRVNACCEIIGDDVTGPYFIQGLLSGHRYTVFSSERLPLLLENITLQTCLSIWFQHDGYSTHYSLVVG